ncbi:winged helix DNA-binding domain-containing protein [Angustibacter aerolatus]
MLRVKPSDVGPLRVLAQRLAGPPHADAASVVRATGAVQAQDLPGALVSVALRTASRERAGVEAALGDGSVVRTWPQRGTLHLVPGADAGWMVRQTGARVLRGQRRRFTELGLDDDSLPLARAVAERELADGPRRRADLAAAWADAGLPGGQAPTHLLGALSMLGVVCLGPLDGREQLVVLLDAWVPAPRDLDGDDALLELAGRWARSHGPGTERDLAWWTGLPVTAVRRALAALVAAGTVVEVDVDGTRHVVDPAVLDGLADARRAARAPLLLPGFDEFVLGYARRDDVLDPACFERVVPGGNGMFRATVVDAGRVVAVWKRAGTPARRTADVEPFGSLSARAASAVPRLLARPPWAGT